MARVSCWKASSTVSGGAVSRFSGDRPSPRSSPVETRSTSKASFPSPCRSTAASSPPSRNWWAGFESPSLPELPPLHSGLVGYLGYDVVREVERLGSAPADSAGLPDAVVSVIGELVAFDHWRQRVTLVDNVVVPTRSGAPDLQEAARRFTVASDHLEQLRRDLERPDRDPLLPPPERGDRLPDSDVRRVISSEQFQLAVEVAKEHIRAGDAFQIVLSQRFDLELGCDPFDVYRVLRQVNPSPYMFFLRQGGVTMVGASPEPLVQLLDGRVVSRPIAGTRRRGHSEEEDRRLEAELVEHPKEVAEHVMLVDLARNDVGPWSLFNTERVDELMTVERYSHVMHLTSQVSGQLVDGKGPIDVLRATLSGGNGLRRPEGTSDGDHRRLSRPSGALRRGRRIHRLLREP